MNAPEPRPYPFTPSNPLWLVGCGNMAGAMLSRWLQTGLDPDAVLVIDPNRSDAPGGVRLVAAIPADDPGALLIGVKPQSFHELQPRLADIRCPVMSIMAGIRMARLRETSPHASGIVRIMPNLPVALGKGVALLLGDEAIGAMADSLAAPLGFSLWLDDEDLFDAGTAVSGSGPAFVYRFIDALASGAEHMGFAADQAQRLALATIDGAVALALASSDDPGTLADRVASPGGTTRAGLNVLDAESAMKRLMAATLDAANQRAREMARAIR